MNSNGSEDNCNRQQPSKRSNAEFFQHSPRFLCPLNLSNTGLAEEFKGWRQEAKNDYKSSRRVRNEFL